MRINQYLARSGVCSRRKAEELIRAGKVSVNRQIITDLTTKINPNDVVLVEGKEVKLADHKYYLLNKPAGYTVTKSDPHASKTIFELLPKDNSLFPVGRLDRETEGLIIVTNDGKFGQNLIHPSKKIQKEYFARLEKDVNNEDLKRLELGVELQDGPAKAIQATGKGREVTIVIEEGRNRQVRRMFEAIGNKVLYLKRTRIGSTKLDVEMGKFRELTEEEVRQID